MPHSRPILALPHAPLSPALSIATRRATLLASALAVLLGCPGEQRPAPSADTSRPAASSPAAESARPAAPLDTATKALADSAAALDARFQRERAALNAEAVVMDTMLRTSPQYAERFAAHRRRTEEASRLRASRDSLRADLARRATP